MIEEDVRELLIRIGALMRKDYSEALRSLSIHVGQDHALCELWKEEGITQAQLSERMRCEPPTVSNMVKKLENYGLVERSRDENDGRISRIHLTDKGRDLRTPVTDVWKNQQERIMQGIQPEELLLMRRVLIQMIDNLS